MTRCIQHTRHGLLSFGLGSSRKSKYLWRKRLDKPTFNLVTKSSWTDASFVKLTPINDAVLELR